MCPKILASRALFVAAPVLNISDLLDGLLH